MSVIIYMILRRRKLRRRARGSSRYSTRSLRSADELRFRVGFEAAGRGHTGTERSAPAALAG